jgi:hypothetical protein
MTHVAARLASSIDAAEFAVISILARMVTFPFLHTIKTKLDVGAWAVLVAHVRIP